MERMSKQAYEDLLEWAQANPGDALGFWPEEDKVPELLGSVFACEQADLEWVDAHEETFFFSPPPDKRLNSQKTWWDDHLLVIWRRLWDDDDALCDFFRVGEDKFQIWASSTGDNFPKVRQAYLTAISLPPEPPPKPPPEPPPEPPATTSRKRGRDRISKGVVEEVARAVDVEQKRFVSSVGKIMLAKKDALLQWAKEEPGVALGFWPEEEAVAELLQYVFNLTKAKRNKWWDDHFNVIWQRFLDDDDCLCELFFTCENMFRLWAEETSLPIEQQASKPPASASKKRGAERNNNDVEEIASDAIEVDVFEEPVAKSLKIKLIPLNIITK
jgi:hypothetical protein